MTRFPILIPALLLSTSALAHDSVRRDFSTSPCYPQFERLMRTWAPESSWRKIASDSKTSVYTASVATPETVEVYQIQKVLKDNTLTVLRQKDEDQTQVQLDPKKKCAVDLENFQTKAGDGRGFFTDRDLARRIALKEPFFVYVWSPAMPYSREGLPLLKTAAEIQGLEGVVTIDPWFPTNTETEKLPRLRSNALIANGALNHFPALMVYDGSGMACPPFHGLDTVAGYGAWIRKCVGNE